MECDYTSCVWNDSHKGCIKPKKRACTRPFLEKMKKMKRQQTNADRIRAMSDEELAKMVVCPHTGNWDLCKDDCKKCRLEWLKQPAEGE